MGEQTTVSCTVPALNEAQLERFWSHVTVEGEHLIWSGPAADGQPQAHLQRRPRRVRLRAHVVAWSLLKDVEPGSQFLLRTCDRPLCIAPEHHKPGTVGDLPHNSLDRRARSFWDCVDRSGGADACWEWQGVVALRYGRPGYAHTSIQGKPMNAHRAAWIFTNGPIPDGLVVCHSCDNPPCCNPAHLWLGTPAENSADMVAKGRANPNRRGENATPAKMTDAQVAEMRALYAAGGISQAALARRYGVSVMSANRAIRGFTFRDVPMAENT